MYISPSPLSNSSVFNKTTSPDYPHRTSILLLCCFKAVSGALLLSSHRTELYFLPSLYPSASDCPSLDSSFLPNVLLLLVIVESCVHSVQVVAFNEYWYIPVRLCLALVLYQRRAARQHICKALQGIAAQQQQQHQEFFLYPTLVYRQHPGCPS